MKKVGINIKRIRKSKKLTLTDVAVESGYDAGNLSKLERGLIGWTDRSLESVAAAIGVAVRDLFLTSEESKLLALWESLTESERSVVARIMGEAAKAVPAHSIPDTTHVIIDRQGGNMKSIRLPMRINKNDNQPAGRLHLRYTPTGTES